MTDESHFIDGIFNYCDRWCERCPFTARCRLYAMEKADAEADPATRDINNAAFWEKMADNFAQAIAQLKQLAAERGVDLNEIAAEPPKSKRKKNPFARPAMKYLRWVDRWIKARTGSFKRKRNELVSAARMQLPGANPLGEAHELKDAFEVIQWYQHFIFVKLARAWSGKDDDTLLDDDGQPFPRDDEGSAKVALIAIDRSLAAWSRLRTHFPEKADELLDVLVHLEKLRRQVEATFPTARAFRRPGFDEVR